MLFVKYISGLWSDRYARYWRQYGDDDERIRRKLERGRFLLLYVELKVCRLPLMNVIMHELCHLAHRDHSPVCFAMLGR